MEVAPFVIVSYSEPLQPLQCFAFLPLLFAVVLPIPSFWPFKKCYLSNNNKELRKAVGKSLVWPLSPLLSPTLLRTGLRKLSPFLRSHWKPYP